MLQSLSPLGSRAPSPMWLPRQRRRPINVTRTLTLDPNHVDIAHGEPSLWNVSLTCQYCSAERDYHRPVNPIYRPWTPPVSLLAFPEILENKDFWNIPVVHMSVSVLSLLCYFPKLIHTSHLWEPVRPQTSFDWARFTTTGCSSTCMCCCSPIKVLLGPIATHSLSVVIDAVAIVGPIATHTRCYEWKRCYCQGVAAHGKCCYKWRKVLQGISTYSF